MIELLILCIAFLVCMLIAFPLVMGARGTWRLAAELGGRDPALFGGAFVLACFMFLVWGGDIIRGVSAAWLDMMEFWRWHLAR